MTGGPLTPDQIVYAGSFPLLLDLEGVAPDEAAAMLGERLLAHTAAHQAAPIIVVAPGLGLFAVGDTWAQADTARHIYLDALRVGEAALRLGGVRHLLPEERRFIEDWEAEAYRKQVAAGDGAPGRAAGRVALVTGAAQGFGLAIAEDLVANGAHVVLADLNVPLAEANAAALEERFGIGRATAVAMDVTDEASVEAGVRAVVRRYGGLDILVSNAGVLRAGGVTAQPVADFDLVTRVNYRGYFLAVKHAAPVMARQHAANPAWWGDIIEINSKSGLTGSSRNSAYAGSKFGGIGLTQSFALELVGDGIKVNAICPGNFLDGPLWSDPNNGLFVQYLREGKVPGATSVDDVRKPTRQGPMGRGCTAVRRRGGRSTTSSPSVRDRPGRAGDRRPGDAQLITLHQGSRARDPTLPPPSTRSSSSGRARWSTTRPRPCTAPGRTSRARGRGVRRSASRTPSCCTPSPATRARARCSPGWPPRSSPRSRATRRARAARPGSRVRGADRRRRRERDRHRKWASGSSSRPITGTCPQRAPTPRSATTSRVASRSTSSSTSG